MYYRNLGPHGGKENKFSSAIVPTLIESSRGSYIDSGQNILKAANSNSERRINISPANTTVLVQQSSTSSNIDVEQNLLQVSLNSANKINVSSAKTDVLAEQCFIDDNDIAYEK